MPNPLDTMVIEVTSPDKKIKAKVRDRRRVQVAFRPGVYGSYEHAALEHQLGQLASLTWTAYLRGYRAGVKKAGRVINDWDVKRRAYREELSKLRAYGVSQHEFAKAYTNGLVRWKLELQSHAQEQLSEQQFVAEVESAVANTIIKYEERVVLLKDKHFRFDLPPSIRQALDALPPPKG